MWWDGSSYYDVQFFCLQFEKRGTSNRIFCFKIWVLAFQNVFKNNNQAILILYIHFSSDGVQENYISTLNC